MYKENDKLNFSNCYCDIIEIYNNLLVDKNLNFSSFCDEEVLALYEFILAKNYKAGVKDIFIINNFCIDLSNLATKYNLNIKNIVNAENIFKIPSSLLVGDNIIVEIKNFEEYNDSFLSEVVSFCSKLDLPVLIHFANDLSSLGKISSKYNKAPEKVLEDFGFLDRKCFLLGCNYLDKDALSLLANYDVEYIFTPCSDAENGKGFLNYKLFENKNCHIGTASQENIDLLKEIEYLRLSTNNLLCNSELVDLKNYEKLLSLSKSNFVNANQFLCNMQWLDNTQVSNDLYLKRLLKSKVDLNIDNFFQLKEKVLNLLALACQKKLK